MTKTVHKTSLVVECLHFYMLRLWVSRGKERILIAPRNGESVMLGDVQISGQSLTVHCQIVLNDVDLGMVIVTDPWWRELQINYWVV